MGRNVEIKARLANLPSVEKRAAEIASEGPTEILQDDTFFPCERGRLKLRKFSDTAGELIHYERADEEGPKESFYVCAPTAAPDLLREALTRAHGTAGRVRKRRTLYIAGRTRIHIDRVEGLGDHLELEVVLDEGEPVEAGLGEAYELMEQLGIDRSQLLKGAYVDLLGEAAS